MVFFWRLEATSLSLGQVNCSAYGQSHQFFYLIWRFCKRPSLTIPVTTNHSRLHIIPRNMAKVWFFFLHVIESLSESSLRMKTFTPTPETHFKSIYQFPFSLFQCLCLDSIQCNYQKAPQTNFCFPRYRMIFPYLRKTGHRRFLFFWMKRFLFICRYKFKIAHIQQ